MTATLKPIENTTCQEVLAAFQKYQEFAKALFDAYAIVDADGRVVKANQLFSQLSEERPKQVLKADSFDSLLRLYIDDEPFKISKIMEYQTATRIDEVRGENKTSNSLNLIVGIYPFFSEDESRRYLGTFILLRDVTAEKNLHDIYKTTKTKSITDPLTGLFTRRYFEDFLSLCTKKEKAGHSDGPLCLVMIDIDYFKKVNDDYGHQAGDHILQIMGDVLGKGFRKTDIPCRYGGEEFLIILVSTEACGAVFAAEKIRNIIDGMEIIHQGVRIPLTISAGIAQVDFSMETYQDALKRADEALYYSKENGRNQVTLHDGIHLLPNAKKSAC